MELKISAPGLDLDDDDRARIERSMEKIDRRLKSRDLVYAEVRISGAADGAPSRKVTIELEFGRKHLVATAEDAEGRRALNRARDEILRQINDGKRRGSHSDYAKR